VPCSTPATIAAPGSRSLPGATYRLARPPRSEGSEPVSDGPLDIDQRRHAWAGLDAAPTLSSALFPPSTTTDAPVAAPVFTAQDAIDVVDAIGLAYDTYEVELFMAVTAPDFQFVDERGAADQAIQASYFPALREGGQKGEIIGDPVIVSEDPFVVAVDARITADWYPAEGRVGTSTYTLVVENGELKVQEHRWTGDLLQMGVPTGVSH
jgi:hypothetical protein